MNTPIISLPNYPEVGKICDFGPDETITPQEGVALSYFLVMIEMNANRADRITEYIKVHKLERFMTNIRDYKEPEEHPLAFLFKDILK